MVILLCVKDIYRLKERRDPRKREHRNKEAGATKAEREATQGSGDRTVMKDLRVTTRERETNLYNNWALNSFFLVNCAPNYTFSALRIWRDGASKYSVTANFLLIVG